MDESRRKITKIARVAQRYAALRLRETGLGTSEYECLHYVRKFDGLTQERLTALLSIDKSAVTRMVTNLARKGFVERRPSAIDGRAKCVFATEKARALRGATHSVEADFYAWLLADVTGDDRAVFLRVLDAIYQKSRAARDDGFAALPEARP